MASLQRCELPIEGVECAECARHIQQAIAEVPRVESVQVLPAAGKAIVWLDPERVDRAAIVRAISG